MLFIQPQYIIYYSGLSVSFYIHLVIVIQIIFLLESLQTGFDASWEFFFTLGTFFLETARIWKIILKPFKLECLDGGGWLRIYKKTW